MEWNKNYTNALLAAFFTLLIIYWAYLLILMVPDNFEDIIQPEHNNIFFISDPLPPCVNEYFNYSIYENDTNNKYILESAVFCDGSKTLTLRYMNFTKVK